MSTHCATVYFAVCQRCGKQSPFKANHATSVTWLKNHTLRKHRVQYIPDAADKIAAVGPMPIGGH